MTPRSSTPVLEFRERESVRRGVARLAASLASAAAGLASNAPGGQPDAVHAVRLLLKRARALVRLLGDNLEKRDAKRMRSLLRQAGRRLAVARDRDVGRALLEDLAAKTDASRRAAVQNLAGSYAAMLPQRAPSARATQSHLRRAALDLARWSRSLPNRLKNDRGWKVLRDGLEAGYRRARKRFRRASTLSREDAFHAWRGAVKTVQYHVAFLRPAAPKPLTRLLRLLDNLGTALGTEHDLAMLDQFLARHAAKQVKASEVESVRRWVANRQQFHRKEALKMGRRLFGQAPSDFVRHLHRAWKRWRKA